MRGRVVHTITAVRRKRQFNLGYRESFRAARAIAQKTLSLKKNKKQRKRKKMCCGIKGAMESCFLLLTLNI